jgi:hypothetical protein
MSTNELVGLIGGMGRHYHQGGVGYTWLDAALDVVGERGKCQRAIDPHIVFCYTEYRSDKQERLVVCHSRRHWPR